MKKFAQKMVIVFILVLTAGMFSGCLITTYVLAYGAAELIGQGIGAIADAAWDATVVASKRNRALKGKDNPFGTEIEDRLLRRTSDLADGTRIDITPYLLHDDSFQIVEDTVKRSEDSIDIKATKEDNSLCEYTANITFEVNKQPYQLAINIAAVAPTGKKAERFVKDNMWKPIAARYELQTKDIKKRKVQLVEPRYGTRLPFSYKGLLICEIQPCYYQFDVEVEYQKTNNVLRKVKPEDFDTFNKVYRSDLQNATAAAIDVQAAIWADARKAGFDTYNFFTSTNSYTPMPRVNFVKVTKNEK